MRQAPKTYIQNVNCTQNAKWIVQEVMALTAVSTFVVMVCVWALGAGV